MAHARRPLNRLLVAALVGLLAACASAPATHPGARSPPPAVTVPPGTPPSAPTVAAAWRALMIAPLGSALSSLRAQLHESWYFRDTAQPDPGTAQSGVDPEQAELQSLECFAPNGAPPELLDQVPSEYTLCFAHDQLTHYRIALRLPAAAAPAAWQDLCDRWLPLQRTLTARAPTDGEVCRGRAATIAYSARLEFDGESDEAVIRLDIRLVAEGDSADQEMR